MATRWRCDAFACECAAGDIDECKCEVGTLRPRCLACHTSMSPVRDRTNLEALMDAEESKPAAVPVLPGQRGLFE